MLPTDNKLKHYANQYYDPQKAHDYYEKNKHLKGRTTAGLNDFENKWGSINNNYRTLLHWLLKYKYVINWSREVYENYLPITLEFLKNNWRCDFVFLDEVQLIDQFEKHILLKGQGMFY